MHLLITGVVFNWLKKWIKVMLKYHKYYLYCFLIYYHLLIFFTKSRLALKLLELLPTTSQEISHQIRLKDDLCDHLLLTPYWE